MKQEHPISSHTILQRNPKQLYSTIDDEVVMLSIEHEEYLNLNQQASYIWQKLESPVSFNELIDQLCAAFNVERDECIKDTMEFVTELAEKEIIQIVHEKAP